MSDNFGLLKARTVKSKACEKFDILNNWKLSYAEDDGTGFEYTSIKDTEMADKPLISASVPGNFELDLLNAGVLTKDPYVGDGCLELRKYEYYHMFYSCEFDWNEDVAPNEDIRLCAEGIDTVADIYLNGEKIGSCENMFIGHKFDLKGLNRGKNEIFVHIKPAVIEAREYTGSIGVGMMSYSYEAAYIRKAAHGFGWDIAPRVVSSGIWRQIYIVKERRPKIKECYLIADNYNAETKVGMAHLRYIIDIGRDRLDDYEIAIDAECGESSFHIVHKPWFVANRVGFEIQNCKRWNVRGKGAANLYDVTVSLVRRGEVADYKTFRFGHRNVSLLNTETVDESGNGEFRFIINDEPVFVMGTNHVPVDMFHSKDRERIKDILDLVADCGCNAIRCWGGGVYEDDIFYDICDEYGIMVWQDFAMACGTYPRDERMQGLLKTEAEAVVKRLRQHACVCLWAGDNECDMMQMYSCNRELNVLTREVLPRVINSHDGTRPYLPSSPYISPKVYKSGCGTATEQHLWGPRDYFKGEYYKGTKACFASEIGYHGCPSRASIERFIDKEYLWPPKDNKQWILHCTSPEYPKGEYVYRVELMMKQIKNLFGRGAEDLDEFVQMSQISQAEADKYFIEKFRINKKHCGGIIWWNIMDCWPQFSDAVVDYYFEKKRAYYYIKAAQQRFCIMADEKDGRLEFYAVNDYDTRIRFEYKICDAETNAEVLPGEAEISANGADVIGAINTPSTNKFYKIEWRIKDSDDSDMSISGENHYLHFKGTIDFKRYKKCAQSLEYLPEFR